MGTGSDRMLQNTNVPENSQRLEAGMPGVVRWGVIGGGDRERFAAGLRHVTGAKLTSVWTRKREVAEAFAAHFGGATTCTLGRCSAVLSTPCTLRLTRQSSRLRLSGPRSREACAL